MQGGQVQGCRVQRLRVAGVYGSEVLGRGAGHSGSLGSGWGWGEGGDVGGGFGSCRSGGKRGHYSGWAGLQARRAVGVALTASPPLSTFCGRVRRGG